MKPHYQAAATTETILWGCKKNEPDYMEEVLYSCKGWVNEEDLMNKGKSWANQNGYDRLRIAKIDLATAPNFIKTLN